MNYFLFLLATATTIIPTTTPTVIPTASPNNGSDIYIKLIPLFSGIISAIVVILTTVLKDKLWQDKRERNNFLKEILQNCYTPLHLSLQTTKDFKLGFLNENINNIILRNGHLLESRLLLKYIKLIDSEKIAKNHLDIIKKIEKRIDDTEKYRDSLDRSNKDIYNKRFDEQ